MKCIITDKDRLRERQERIARLYVIIARLAQKTPLNYEQQSEVEDIVGWVAFDDMITELPPTPN